MSEATLSAELRKLAVVLRQDRLLDCEAPLLERAAVELETPAMSQRLREDVSKELMSLLDVVRRHQVHPHTQTTNWPEIARRIGALLGRLVLEAEATAPPSGIGAVRCSKCTNETFIGEPHECVTDSPLDPEREPAVTLTDGRPVTADHREIEPSSGMQKAYVVLSAAERAKGFVRPVRRSYVHVGARPKHPTRDLTDEERERYAAFGYVKFEEYPAGSPSIGRYWTEAQLQSGCGIKTTMGQSIAETYARDPKFYGATFCAGCRKHLPIGADGEFTWDGTDERVGT